MIQSKNKFLSKMQFLVFALLFVIAGNSCKQAGTTYYSEETQALLNHLNSLSKKGTMIGHQDALAFGTTWRFEENRSDIRDVCGDYPAVFGWDLGAMEIKGTPGWTQIIGQDHQTYPVSLDTLRQFIRKVHDWGGINSISAHINNPATGNDTWDKTPVVHTLLPGGENHDLYLKWLDETAGFFLSLKDSEGKLIPVIFRPFHELNGDWFWWGKGNCSTEEFIALWKFTVDYLKKEKKVNNLLYSYSTDRFRTEEEFTERYPGDDYVDMLGFDIYHHDNEPNDQFIALARNCVSILENLSDSIGKPFAITEIGRRSNIADSTWWTEVLYPIIKDFDLSYVLIWRNKNHPDNFFAPYPGHASADDFIALKKKPEIFFLQDINK